MSHRPFSRDNEGFRPWKRNEDRPADGDRARGPAGATDPAGNYRTDNVWRSSTAHASAERGPEPRRDDDRSGGGDRSGGDRSGGGQGGGFAPRPWQRRDDDRSGGGQGGGFAPRPWQRRDDDRSGGGDRGGQGGGFAPRPWQRRDDDRSGGGGGFAPRPWQRRDDDRSGGDRGGQGGGFAPRPWQRRDDDRSGAQGGQGGGFAPRPWQRRDDDRSGGGDRGGQGGGFAPRPWQRRDDDRSSGGDRGGQGGGFAPRPWQRRDDDRSGGQGGGAGPRPWQRRDEDRPGTERSDGPAAPKRRIPDAPEGELIYGRQPVSELLKAGRRNVRELLLADGVKSTDELAAIEALCLERSIGIRRFDREVFDAWLNAANHQGVIAVCAAFPYTDFDEILALLRAAEGNALIVLLDHVVDPQNLGSLMRSCEAAGAVGVVLPADRAVGVTPASVRASAGAAEHLRIAVVPSLVSTLEKLKDKDLGVWITGLESSEEARPYTEIDFKGKVALVIGSEGAGLSRPVREKCDFLAKLPMCGKVGSLNAGVAGALAMYEVLRQHGRK